MIDLEIKLISGGLPLILTLLSMFFARKKLIASILLTSIAYGILLFFTYGAYIFIRTPLVMNFG